MSLSVEDPLPDTVGSGVVLELQEESVDPTNPFSSSYIHHRLENDAREGDGSERSSKTNSFSNSVIEARIRTSKQQGASQLRQGYPIASLASTHLDCRLLFQPAEVDGIEIPGAESVTLLPLEVQSTESTGGVQCFVIRESPEHTSCYIAKPFPYVMYFDPYHDSVVVSNQAEFPLHIKPSRPAKPTETESDDIGSVSELTISPYSNGLLAIGSWILGTPDVSCVFQVKIFPRTRVLEVMALSLRHIAGSKRDATGQDAVDEPRMDSSTVTRQVGCLSELVDGEVARFSAPYKEKDSNFTLFRMRRIGETKSAIVFQARHSGYSKQIIVVKAFKRSSGRDAVVRAKSWHNEHKIHLGIQSEHIVKLLGGDARVHALFLEHIDAKDLGQKAWCDFTSDHKFRGTESQALCVLRDMAQGLQYLRTKGVLHNDIKPANILFNGKKAVLIDFGLAMFDRFGTLSSGGTPWYIPPEYLRTKERKAPADIWALGVVGLYLRRQIRLPDTGLDVPSWLIRDIGPLPSAAKNQMEQWLNFVRSEASKSARASDLGGLVAQMLGIRSAERPTPDELVKSLESLVIASEVD